MMSPTWYRLPKSSTVCRCSLRAYSRGIERADAFWCMATVEVAIRGSPRHAVTEVRVGGHRNRSEGFWYTNLRWRFILDL